MLSELARLRQQQDRLYWQREHADALCNDCPAVSSVQSLAHANSTTGTVRSHCMQHDACYGTCASVRRSLYEPCHKHVCFTTQ